MWQSEERLSNFFNKSINYNAHHRLPPKPKAKILAAETQQWLTKAALFRYTASSYGVKKKHAACATRISYSHSRHAPKFCFWAASKANRLHGTIFSRPDAKIERASLAAPRAACFMSNSGLNGWPRLRQKPQQLKLKRTPDPDCQRKQPSQKSGAE